MKWLTEFLVHFPPNRKEEVVLGVWILVLLGPFPLPAGVADAVAAHLLGDGDGEAAPVEGIHALHKVVVHDLLLHYASLADHLVVLPEDQELAGSDLRVLFGGYLEPDYHDLGLLVEGLREYLLVLLVAELVRYPLELYLLLSDLLALTFVRVLSLLGPVQVPKPKLLPLVGRDVDIVLLVVNEHARLCLNIPTCTGRCGSSPVRCAP